MVAASTQNGEELWESQVPGQVWIKVTENGVSKSKKVQGVGAKLRLSMWDRKLTQERIRDKVNDPFVNGMLVRLGTNQQEDPETASPSAMTDEDLMNMFKTKPMAKFRDLIDPLTEVSLRRLADLAKDNDSVTANQERVLTETLTTKYEQIRYIEPKDLTKYERLSGDFTVKPE